MAKAYLGSIEQYDTVLPLAAPVYPLAFLGAIWVLLGPGPGPGGDEGGYSNDPNDPGGETNWGIDKRSHPDVDIKNLTRDEAIAIYWSDYWPPVRPEYLGPVGPKLFNIAVNTGWGRANMILQRAVGVTQDGIVGPLTLAALAKIHPAIVLTRIRVYQAAFYQGLGDGRSSLRGFVDGWLKRATH